MRDLNQCTFTGTIGHVEQDTSGNNPSTTVSLYISDDYKDKSDNWVNRSHRINIKFWGKSSDNIFKFFNKGDKVSVTARVMVSTRDDSYAIFFNGDNMNLISRKDSGDASKAPQGKNSSRQTARKRPQSNYSKSKQTDDDDDEVGVDDLDSLFDPEELPI